MSYFDRPEISVSDLKALIKKMGGGTDDPVNLQAIFEFGSMFHSTILEPHLTSSYNVTDEETRLAQQMRKTFFSDELNRMIIMRPDFKREHPMFKEIEVGGMRYNARIKCDGISEGISTVLEIKGLSVTNRRSFDDAIDRMLYDMAAVQYLLVSGCDKMIIVGISKINPRLMFKKIIKKYDEVYNEGEEKLKTVLQQWREIAPEDIKMVA